VVASFDVAVVGAGIVGSATALACAHRGARVALLERDEPGRAASGVAAGILAPGSESGRAGPFLELSRQSLALWPSLAAELGEATGIDCELALDGLLRVALDGADAQELRTRLDGQAHQGLSARWLDAEALAAVEPQLAAGVAGVLYADEGQVNSALAVAALVSAACRRGAVLRAGAEVVGPSSGGGVRLSSGEELHAGTVVIAAGPWSPTVATRLGAPALPVRPVRGQLIHLVGLPRLPRYVLYAGGCGYAVARRDGTLVVGATEEDAGFDAAVTAAATEQLLATARRLLRGAELATLSQARAALRPCAPDGLPLLGALPGARPRLLVATAHHRNGVLLAPVTALGMASLALEGVTPPGWEAFDPGRFG